jgi:hypothetical protein
MPSSLSACSPLAALALCLALLLGAGPVAAQPSPAAPAAATGAAVALDAIKGTWVRTDGQYAIQIRAIDSSGKLEASYANPKPLPFAKAVARSDAGVIRLDFELRAGGYDGSTYQLVLDPATDTLRGVYYQAVAQQKYPVVFRRLPPAQGPAAPAS